MKVERQVRKQPEPPFESFDLVITVESEEEARGLYAIFNRTYNTVVLPREMPQKIRDVIGAEYYTLSQITEEVSYKDYYPGWPKRPE